MADRKCRSASSPWTCKYPEGQNANLEKIPWNTSATVAFVGSCPKCPQGVYLTSSSMELQGSVPHLSQSPEASCEFMENPRGWSEDKEKARRKLMDSVHFLLCALLREKRRTVKLQKELTDIKKILTMPPKKGHGCDGRRQSFREVSKVSHVEVNIPVAMGEAAAKENLVCIQENPGTTVLTQMELEMKELKSALSEVHAQEHLVKKDLEALKQLYRGELESIDGMSLELCM
ncbi:ankyrin repeat domain-containing protein 26 isoform X2 [Alexandromys fortis]|uniref:ankyrin repeat domain-containing protein 26 isoform X2 n=1 Tax=Alexandromys fortis TaxID=100897 RepID=UPI0021526E12|nr:uncharacterized protein LOC126507882 isoform X2 [Microtus fortis]